MFNENLNKKKTEIDDIVCDNDNKDIVQEK